MKKYAIIVYWSDEDAVWIAEAPDLDPCAAHGDTPEQAFELLKQGLTENYLKPEAAAGKLRDARTPEAELMAGVSAEEFLGPDIAKTQN